MTIDWYKIVNKEEFEATGLVSRELDLVLPGIGLKTFLITVGNFFSLTVDDVMLSVGVTSDNPFMFQDRAIALDENGDVWWGIKTS